MKEMIESMIIAGCMLVTLLYIITRSNELGIQQMYELNLATLPVQTTVIKGEEVEICYQLVRSGEYQDTKYFIKYSQPTDKEKLRVENSTILLPNGLYPLLGGVFRLYYRPFGTDQQKVDIYILDSFDQVVQKLFASSSEAEGEREGTE